MGERAELMAQGEVFENEGPSREGQSVDRPDEKLQKEQHRREMRADRGDCNRLRLNSRSKAGRMEFWRGTGHPALVAIVQATDFGNGNNPAGTGGLNGQVECRSQRGVGGRSTVGELKSDVAGAVLPDSAVWM
jgi:hypothetical protein